MDNVCPVTCSVIQEAIKIQLRLGVTLQQQAEYKKQHCAKCLMCFRNEFATEPYADMSCVKGDENNG